jgi:hypothetical protein
MMAMVTTSIEEVRQALRDRKFEKLLGLRESSWLDVKSGLYQFTHSAGIEELVKDVAAFANAADGGLLLIGFKTVADHDSEIISELRPIPRSLVDLDRHRKLIHERITPIVRDLRVEWIDYEDQKGVLCIDIPAQPNASRPFVIPAPSGNRGSATEPSVAVPLRVGDGTQWLPKSELQRLLAAGWAATGGPGTAPVTQTQPPDRTKAARLLEVIPVDAPWVKAQKNVSMHRVPAWVSEAAFMAQHRVSGDIVDFLDPDVAAAHEAMETALDALCEELAGLFPPTGPSHPSDRYAEIPPEWKRTDPARYRKALDDLTSASDSFLDKYQQCVNLLNKKGLLPPS